MVPTCHAEREVAEEVECLLPSTAYGIRLDAHVWQPYATPISDNSMEGDGSPTSATAYLVSWRCRARRAGWRAAASVAV